MSDKEAWEYVIRNEDLIWYFIHIRNVPESWKEDVFSEARIILVERLKMYGEEYVEEYSSAVFRSSIEDARKGIKDNVTDYNHLVKRNKKKVIAC